MQEKREKKQKSWNSDDFVLWEGAREAGINPHPGAEPANFRQKKKGTAGTGTRALM